MVVVVLVDIRVVGTLKLPFSFGLSASYAPPKWDPLLPGLEFLGYLWMFL
jgi:hypothetical protein